MLLRPVLPLLLALVAAAALPGCQGPLQDQPSKVRQRGVLLPPLFTCKHSPDGTSYDWNAIVWLVGHDVEGSRTHTRVLPFYWHDDDPPYLERTLWFPFWYSRDGAQERSRFLSLLYGYDDSAEQRTDYVLLPLIYAQRSKVSDAWRSGLLLIYDWRHEGSTDDVVFISLFGLATLVKVESGRPPEGETVPALGREHSRRFEIANILNIITLFGYDDIGDRREFRAFTFLGSQALSPLRSWRGRGDDPFVREWIFPFYMNMQDADGGWLYVGPLWGQTSDTAAKSTTDWWLAGLLARTHAPEGNTWRVLGIPIIGP